MKQEFITSRGKLIIERNIIFNRVKKVHLSESIAYKLFLAFVPPIVFILTLFFEDLGPKKYIHLVMWGIFIFINFHHLIDVLIKLSFSNRIPINSIQSFEIKEDDLGLETFVHLRLKSGRTRKIVFRTLEMEYEPFTALLSQHSVQPQFA
jgi:hypothetical protein